MPLVKKTREDIRQFPQAIKEIAPGLQIPTLEKGEPGKIGWGEVLGRSIVNFPRSIWDVVKDIGNQFLHPVETAKAMGKVTVAAAQKFIIPGEQSLEYLIDNLIEIYKQKYGGVENFKYQLAENPGEVLSDMSLLLMGGGGAAVKAGLGVGKAVGKVGAAIEPLGLVGRGVKFATTKPVKSVLEGAARSGLPERLFTSVVKLNPMMPKTKRERLINTAFEKKAYPTVEFLDTLDADINNLKKSIGTKIDKLTETGVKVPLGDIFRDLKKIEKGAKYETPPSDILKPLRKIKQDIYKANIGVARLDAHPTFKIIDELKEISPGLQTSMNKLKFNIKDAITKDKDLGFLKGDINKMKTRVNDIFEAPRAAKINNELNKISESAKQLKQSYMQTPTELQKRKTRIYRSLDKLYAKAERGSPTEMIKKTIARTMKSDLEGLLPKLKPENYKLGSYIDLKKELESTANKLSNREIMGATPYIGNVKRRLAFFILFKTLNKPKNRLKLAYFLDDLRKGGTILPENHILNRIAKGMPSAGGRARIRQIETLKEAQVPQAEKE
jgi:hypothetical protein